MLAEEKSSGLVVHLVIVGFHHKKGHQIEYSYPLLNEREEQHWSTLSSLALPDGAHQREKDLVYFHLPTIDNDRTIFGVAAYQQIDTQNILNKDVDVTRNSIQKSVCLLLREPVYGDVSEELQFLTGKYFEAKDFSHREIFEAFVRRLNQTPPTFDLQFYSIRDLVMQYRRKALILFKLLLLQKKVLFMLSPAENLVRTILSLVSLIPNLIENGLNECTLIGEEERILEHENEDTLFSRDEQEQVDFDQLKLKTLKTDDEDDIASTTSVEIPSEKNPNQILKRATSITNKLTDTFNRLTQPTINIPYEQQLIHSHQVSFTYPLFQKNNNLHPYLSIYSLDLITSPKINSFLIGATNGLFRQQNNLDFILNDNDEDFLIPSSQLKQQLQLTTADLRFTQLFEHPNDGVKSEEELRHLFTTYFLSLLSVAQTPNDEALNDFNSSYVQSFQSTYAYRLWRSKGPYADFDQILPRHPQAGQLNVTDVKLRVAHVLDESEAGRKFKGALEDTSVFMGEKSRAATKVLGQAKNSLFTSVVGTFNQGKQWLSKPNTQS